MRQETDRRLDHTDRERGPAPPGWLLRPPTLAGTAVALLFWWWSLDPSTLPRSPSAQGAVSGLSAAIGYLLGTLAGHGVGALLRRLDREKAAEAGTALYRQAWRRPAWTDSPEGYDVPARAGWFPIVTGLQQVADLIAGFSASSGYGHNYSIDFAAGWAAVVPPEGWTTTDTNRLQRHLPSK